MYKQKKVSRTDLHKISIISSRQKDNTGCMWHSIYSLTQNIDFLNYQNDNSPFRFLLIVQYYGYLLWPLLAIPKKMPVKVEHWKELYKRCNAHQVKLKLLVSTNMNASDEHVIAVEADFENDIMKLMDPKTGEFHQMDWESILCSDFRNVYEILVLDSGDLDDYRIIPPKVII